MEQHFQESQENKRWTMDPVQLSFKYQGYRKGVLNMKELKEY